MASRFFRSERLSAAKQAYSMSRSYPGFRVTRRGRRTSWVGRIQPTALGQVYTLKIVLGEGRHPRVIVIEPPLQPRDDGEPIPHVYPGDELCLHLPGEWQPRMLLSDTVIPWASVWLSNYETWRATGEWCGGGEHPPQKNNQRSRAA